MSAQVEDSSPPGQFYCPTCEKNFAVGDRCPTDGTRLVKINVPLDPMLGRDLDGRYTIMEKLGQGGMGAVYRGSQHGLGREVAIKVVSAHLVTDTDVVKRFMREAKLASRLSHPNAVAVLDFGQTDDGIFYLVMELVTGRTLDAVLKSEPQLKPERLVRIGAQICDALEGAHGLNIVHRDLKPSNIMLLTSGRDLVKVLDFGLAKSVAPDQTNTTMTNAGALLGTPAFMPPELALGQRCDGRADLYSLGVVLYLAGSGRLPFVSDSAHELIAMHGTDQAPPMTGVPPALARVVDRMLRKDPNERYQTAAENREALEAALDNRYVTPLPGTINTAETNPSIGPFPKTTADLERTPTKTASPNRPSSPSALHSIAISDTIAPQSARRRSKLPLIGGLVLVAALGAGWFFVFGPGKKDAAEPANAADVAKPDVKSGDNAASPASSGDVKSGDVKSGDVKSGDVKSGDLKSGDLKSGDLKSGDVKSGDVKSGVVSGDVKSGDVKSGDLKSADLKARDASSGGVQSGGAKPGDLKSGDLKPGDLRSGDLKAGDAKAAGIAGKPEIDIAKPTDTKTVHHKKTTRTPPPVVTTTKPPPPAPDATTKPPEPVPPAGEGSGSGTKHARPPF